MCLRSLPNCFPAALAFACSVFSADALANDAALKAQFAAYKLTMEKIQAYALARHDYDRAIAKDPVLAKELTDVSEDDDTVEKLAAGISAHPKILRFYQAHGLTAQDAVVLEATLLQAYQALDYDTPQRMLSDEHLVFIKKNKAEIDRLDPLDLHAQSKP